MEAMSPLSKPRAASAAGRAGRWCRPPLFLALPLLLSMAGAAACAAQPANLPQTETAPAASVSAASTPAALTPMQAQALVGRALANELQAAKDDSHPMRYVLHKTTPRLSTTKEIFETRDGEVARLMAMNDKPLSAEDAAREQERLSTLASDPGLQRHRKQSEETDAARALKVLRVLPQAFLYQYAGPMDTAQGTVQRFTFKPNPAFSPPDLETEVLTAMSGEIRIDPASERVRRLEAHLDADVNFGWGILGRLNRGGWIVMEQADVGGGAWRLVRIKMAMSGRVVFRTRVFDTAEEQSDYAPLPLGLRYAEAIETMRRDAKQDAK